jgi:hypothetical protein
MRYSSMFLVWILATAIAVSFPSPTLKAEDNQSPESESAAARESESALGPAAPEESLESQSGGQDESIEKIYLMLGEANMGANVGNNTLTGENTGSNYLNGNAFANSSGMNTVFQVTGSMNILQSSYIINVTIGN